MAFRFYGLKFAITDEMVSYHSVLSLAQAKALKESKRYGITKPKWPESFQPSGFMESTNEDWIIFELQLEA